MSNKIPEKLINFKVYKDSTDLIGVADAQFRLARKLRLRRRRYGKRQRSPGARLARNPRGGYRRQENR